MFPFLKNTCIPHNGFKLFTTHQFKLVPVTALKAHRSMLVNFGSNDCSRGSE